MKTVQSGISNAKFECSPSHLVSFFLDLSCLGRQEQPDNVFVHRDCPEFQRAIASIRARISRCRGFSPLVSRWSASTDNNPSPNIARHDNFITNLSVSIGTGTPYVATFGQPTIAS